MGGPEKLWKGAVNQVCGYDIFLIFPLDILGYSNGSIGAVTVTVIVIHVIMGFYIWVAIKEEEVTQQLKQD